MKKIDIYQTEKRIRAEVIRDYMQRNGISQAVCFSCGNASRYLREAGVPLTDISPRGDMTANRWYTQEEIHRLFPTCFDATSGHLTVALMTEIAERLRAEIALPREPVVVLTGSGESVACLKMAFPDAEIIPCYNDNDPATEYNEGAPLNTLIRAMFPAVRHKSKDNEQTTAEQTQQTEAGAAGDSGAPL